MGSRGGSFVRSIGGILKESRDVGNGRGAPTTTRGHKSNRERKLLGNTCIARQSRRKDEMFLSVR